MKNTRSSVRRSKKNDCSLLFGLVPLMILVAVSLCVGFWLFTRYHMNRLANEEFLKTHTFNMPFHANQIDSDYYTLQHPNSTAIADIFIHRHDDIIPSNDTETGNGRSNDTQILSSRLNMKDDPTYSDLNQECYGPIFTGVRWRQLEPYTLDPSNTAGLSSDFLIQAFKSSIRTWALAAGPLPWGTMHIASLNVNTFTTRNGQNGLAFGSINIEGVHNALAVTILWRDCIDRDPTTFECVGPMQYVEWKQIYDTVRYSWGDALYQFMVYDVQSIMTHENGHTKGLIDEYDPECWQVTMYGYGSLGDIRRRSLAMEDAQGARDLGYKGEMDTILSVTTAKKVSVAISLICIYMCFLFTIIS